MNKKRKICVFTGSRADWGPLMPLAKKIRNNKNLILQILATGSHLSSEFGMTYKEIIKDGFKINKRLNIHLLRDDPIGIANSMGIAISGFAKIFDELKPDIIVGLGDRYELFCAAASALVSGIPFAHISGGDVTEGVIDDSLRHAITKMSHIHFTGTESSRKRVIQLGEDPKRVFNVGEPGLDNIDRGLLSRNKLEKLAGIVIKKKNFLITFHPLTIGTDNSERTLRNLFFVLDQQKDVSMIFTLANADSGGKKINELIKKYVSRNKEKAVSFASMGRTNYLSAMKNSVAVIGNSSSGIIEAPSFKIATIDIGDRQKGREKALSVISCGTERQEILKAFKKRGSAKFVKALSNVSNPYGDGKTSHRICKILTEIDLGDIIRKQFYDIKGVQ